MIYSICIGLIFFASIIMIAVVLVQNPKSGMAANFGASNQVIGVRETSNFLEKATWTMAIAIVVLSLCATMAMDEGRVADSNAALNKETEAIMEKIGTQATMPNQVDLPTVPEQSAEQPAEEAE